MSFRGYVFASLLLTSAVIGHAVYVKRFFYRSVIFLANSKLAILAVGNMALVSVLLMWRLIQAIFLGPLRFREVERLHIRARDAVIECCFAMSIFRSDFDLKFVALVVTLLMLKSLHWLVKDRIEFLEEQPLSPVRAHIRLVGLMTLLLGIDTLLVKYFATNMIKTEGPTFYVLFAFEFTISVIELVCDVIRYCFLLVDTSMEGHWEGKAMFSFYVELLSDLCQLTVYILFFIYIQIYYTFPFHILRELYVTFTRFRRRCSDFWRYRRVVATMNDLFADATEEELDQGDRTCIICREEMQAAKKLACGHIFHARCLQSWLKRQLTCPTCRATIDVNSPSSQPNNAQNAQQENAAGNNRPQQNQPDDNGNRNPAPQRNNQAAVNIGEAGVRLLNLANQWWNQVMIEAGAGLPNADPLRRVQDAHGGRGLPARAPEGNAGGGGPGRDEGAGAGNGPSREVPGVGAATSNGGGMQPQEVDRRQERLPNNAMGGNVFLRGPNAMAHMQFRARRRVAWSRPYQPHQMQPQVHLNQLGYAQDPNRYQQLNTQAPVHTNAGRPQENQAMAQSTSVSSQQLNNNGTTEHRSNSASDSSTSRNMPSTTLEQSSTHGANSDHVSAVSSNVMQERPSSAALPGEHDAVHNVDVARDQSIASASNNNRQPSEFTAQIIPLDRLLAIQERIEELRSEVMDLVLLATAGPSETDASNIAASYKSEDSATETTPDVAQEGEISEGQNGSAPRENSMQRQPGDEQEEADPETAMLRRRRMEYLDRVAGS